MRATLVMCLVVFVGCDDAAADLASDGRPPDSDVSPDVMPTDVGRHLDAVTSPDEAAPDGPAPAPDGAPDAAPDAAPEGTPDGSTDAAVDVAPDAPPDAAPDPMDDAAPDARVDDSADAEANEPPDGAVDGVSPDVSPDGAVDPPPVFEATCDLLVNGGAEQGDLGGWAVEVGDFQARREEAGRIPAPAEGAHLFFAGTTPLSRIAQDVQLGPWPGRDEGAAIHASVRGALRTWAGDDRARLELHALDADGDALGEVVGDLHGAQEWTPRRVDLELPPRTAALRVVLHGERRRGQDNDAYFDAVQLCITDEPPPPPPAEGRVPPYLMWVTTDAVTVLWETANEVRGVVEVEGVALFEEARRATVHEVRVTDLEPDTEYTYAAGDGERRFPSATFRTAPEGAAPFDFVVWGDNQNGPDTFRRLVARMVAEAPAWAASTGDCVQWGLADLYRGELLRPIAPLAATTPFLVAAGNHERLIDFAGNLFDRYMAQPGDEHCFGYAYGDAYFVFVDTELSVRAGSAQYACIDEALGSDAARGASLRSVLFHKPPRVEYWAGFCIDGERDVREHLEPLFARHGVDVVFNGHNHLYAYTPPGDDGITWVTTGGGGGAIDDEDDFCQRWDEIVETHFVHHFLSVRVEDGTMTVRAIDVDGLELHRFEVSPARD